MEFVDVGELFADDVDFVSVWCAANAAGEQVLRIGPKNGAQRVIGAAGLESGVDLSGHFGCASEFHAVVVVTLGGVFDLDFVGGEVDNVFVVADAEDEVLEFTGEQDGAVCFCHRIRISRIYGISRIIVGGEFLVVKSLGI